MQIAYTKEGIRITHPTGVNQLLTHQDLTFLWERAVREVIRVEKGAEKLRDIIKEIERLRQK